MAHEDTTTQGGFEITNFNDANGVSCSLQMSSVATEDRIWLGINDADPQIMTSKAASHGLDPNGKRGWMPYPIHEDVFLNIRMHLNREQVERLIPYLQRFVETGRILQQDKEQKNK